MNDPGGCRTHQRAFAVSVLAALIALIAVPLAAQLPDPKPLSEPRITPLEMSEANAQRKALLGDGPNINVTRTIARHPKLAEAWLTFARYVLSENTLPERDREILILRIGWLCQSEYEFGQHTILGKRVGLSDEEIKRITQGPDAPGWSDHDRALLHATDQLRKDAFIHDETWATLAKTYSTEQMMDVVFTVGEYNLVSMALRTFGVQLDEGVPGFPQ